MVFAVIFPFHVDNPRTWTKLAFFHIYRCICGFYSWWIRNKSQWMIQKRINFTSYNLHHGKKPLYDLLT